MRSTLSALLVATGLLGFAAAAQAAPASPSMQLGGVTADAPIVHVQMMRHRRGMMRHRMMRHRMMRHRMMRRGMRRM